MNNPGPPEQFIKNVDDVPISLAIKINHYFDYKINDSKYNDLKCLKLQFKIDSTKYIIFTGSNILIDQIKKYKDEIPFLTIIKKINKYYTFT